MKTMHKLWIGLGVLAILTPVGLLLPAKLKAGSAWGEWAGDEVKDLVGYIPQGLEKLSSLWKPLVPDYAFKGWGEKGLSHLSLAYVASALLGVALCIGVAWILGRIIIKRKTREPSPP